jgi:hypothetical protein
MLNSNVSTCWLSEYIFSMQEGKLTAKSDKYDGDGIAMQHHVLLRFITVRLESMKRKVA